MDHQGKIEVEGSYKIWYQYRNQVISLGLFNDSHFSRSLRVIQVLVLLVNPFQLFNVPILKLFDLLEGWVVLLRGNVHRVTNDASDGFSSRKNAKVVVKDASPVKDGYCEP